MMRKFENSIGAKPAQIIAVTASPDVQAVQRRCYASGMDGIITKPFKPESLLLVLGERSGRRDR